MPLLPFNCTQKSYRFDKKKIKQLGLESIEKTPKKFKIE